MKIKKDVIKGLTDELIEKYKDNLMTTVEISKYTNRSYKTVGRYFNKYNIIRNYDNKEWLYQKYIIEQLSIADIGRQANCLGQTIKSRLQKYDLENKRKFVKTKKYKYNVSYFKNIDTEEKAYWLGFIYADGHISYKKGEYRLKIQIATKDKQHLELFKKSMDFRGLIKDNSNFDKRTNKTYYSSKISLYSKEICDDLIKLGCQPSKKHLNSFPQIPSNLLRHFLRGYFDGDGCFSLNKSQKTTQGAIVIAGGEQIMENIKMILESVLSVNIGIRYERGMYLLTSGGNLQVEKILKYLYEDNKIALKRKDDKIQVWLSERPIVA